MDDITKINNDADLSRYLDRIPETPYKQGHKKMLTDLINYAVEHQWTLRTLSDKLPVSTTVMHRLLIGNTNRRPVHIWPGLMTCAACCSCDSNQPRMVRLSRRLSPGT